MFKKTLVTASLLLASSPLFAQASAHASAGASASAPHIVSALPAMFTSGVSSASAHAGQPIMAKLASPSTLSNGFKLPAGSQLMGHITQAKSLAEGKGTSSLGMVFDKFKTPDGNEQPLSGMIQSIGSAKAKAQQQQAVTAPQQASGGGLLGGVTGAVSSTVGTVASTTSGLLGSVTGLPGVLITSAGTLNAKGQNVEVPASTSVSITASASTTN